MELVLYFPIFTSEFLKINLSNVRVHKHVHVCVHVLRCPGSTG